MRDYDYATQSDVSLLMGRIDTLEKTIKSLQQNSAPTHPIYDSTNFPQDAVPGQHVQDQNNDMWIYGQDGAWHKIGGGIANDWIYARISLGTVASMSEVAGDMLGSIIHQTDIPAGSVYEEGLGAINTINMVQIGSYLLRAWANFPEGMTGYVEVDAVIGGPVRTYDWDDIERFKAASIPDTTAGTDMGKYGGLVRWSQLIIVDNLTTPAGAYLHFTNNTTSSLIGCRGNMQILRLT